MVPPGALKFGPLTSQGGKTYLPIATAVPDGATFAVRARTTGGDPAPAKVIRPWGGEGPVLVVPTLLATVRVDVDVLNADGCSIARGRTTVRPGVSFLKSKYHSMRSYGDLLWYRDLDRRPCGRSPFVSVDFVYTDGVAWDTIHGTAEFWGAGRETLASGAGFELSVLDSFARTVEVPEAIVLRDEVVPLDDGSWLRRVGFSQNVSHSQRSLVLWARLGGAASSDGFAVMEADTLEFWRGYWRGKRGARPDGDAYSGWYAGHSRASGLELEIQRAKPLAGGSTVSLVIDLSRPDLEGLTRTLDSLASQTHGLWELVGYGGADDGPWHWRDPRWVEKGPSDGDALEDPPSNASEAVARAKGMVVGTVSLGSVLEPDCLYRLCERLGDPDVAMAYGDDDVLSTDGRGHGIPRDAVVKPTFDRTLLYATGYTRRPSLVRRECLTGRPLPSAIDDLRVLDFELALRAIEGGLELGDGTMGTSPAPALEHAIAHVPLVLCHEPEDGQPKATLGVAAGTKAAEACQHALAAHLGRLSLAGTVSEDRESGRGLLIDSSTSGDEPLISIVIPNKDAPEVLETCVISVLGLSDHRNLEVLIVENNSELEATFDTYDRLARDPRVRIVSHEGPFNFSAVCNHGAAESHGGYLVFLNNDTEVIEPAWLDLLRGPIDRGEAGIVGARLLHRDGLLQHAGVALEPNGPNHIEHHTPPGYASYLGLSQSHAHQASAVTGACLMVGRSLFEELGGFDEGFPVAFNDTDLCLRARSLGYGVAVDPRALLWHYESYSRGGDFSDDAKLSALLEAGGRLAGRWPSAYALGDPFYDHRFGYDDVYYGLAGEPSHYARED